MTINYMEEIVTPYNEKHNTKFKSAGEFLADLFYRQKKRVWEVEKITMVSPTTTLKYFQQSEYYDKTYHRRMDYLRPKLKALGREKIATMTSKEIMEKFPGYTEATYYNALREGKYEYKKMRNR